MLSDIKWIKYSILALKEIGNGAISADEISDNTGAPPCYMRKVLASLRRNGLVNKYELTKGLSSITLKDIVAISTVDYKDQVSNSIASNILDRLDFPITDIG